jgi:cytochrome c6
MRKQSVLESTGSSPWAGNPDRDVAMQELGLHTRGNAMKKSIWMVAIFALVVAMAMPALAADGAATYKAKCAMCHGPDGSKENPAMNLKALSGPDVQKKTDAQLIESTSKGVGKMPAYAGKLSDDEIKATIAFIRTLKK